MAPAPSIPFPRERDASSRRTQDGDRAQLADKNRDNHGGRGTHLRGDRPDPAQDGPGRDPGSGQAAAPASIELRLDFLAKAPDFKRLLANRPCPLVATVRRPVDGGRWVGTEDARLMLLRQAIVAGFDWVDLETDVADDIRRFKSVKRIVSYHNMREVPADLEKIHQNMCEQDADVVKIAVRAQQPADNLRVLDSSRTRPEPTVAFCMGDMGLPSRILARRLGAPFTYAAFNKERGIAPGLPSFDELCRIYHYHKINADTQVYGVLGDPVAHSLSPLIHNTAFRQLGINAVYVPFRVPRGDLAAFLKEFDRLPVRGYSVTIPHKEAAAELAKQQDPLVDADAGGQHARAQRRPVPSARHHDRPAADLLGVRCAAIRCASRPITPTARRQSIRCSPICRPVRKALRRRWRAVSCCFSGPAAWPVPSPTRCTARAPA